MTEQEAYETLLNSQPEGERYYTAIRLSHPDFTKTYYLVFDSVPLTAKIETGATVVFEATAMSVDNAVNSNDLDQQASFTIPDVKNILDDELSRVQLGPNAVSPIITQYIYHSEFLDSPVEFVSYDANSVSQKKAAFSVKTGVPDLNKDETGDSFDFDTFPMLRSIS